MLFLAGGEVPLSGTLFGAIRASESNQLVEVPELLAEATGTK